MQIKFIWYDLWIGVYIDRKGRRVYVCPFPCIVLIFKQINYFSEARRSERALCKIIVLAEKMNKRDTKQGAAYLRTLGDME